MPVSLLNFDYSYEKRGRPIFVPSDLGRKIGEDIKAQVESNYVFDDFVFHLSRKGGHVAALHRHRRHIYFARVDISRFFYSIGKNRVRRELACLGIGRSWHYAKWSCVKNPFLDPSYSLPYGFVQSPVLASLVLMQCDVGTHLRNLSLQGLVLPSVYMDDICLSSDDMHELRTAYDELLARLNESNFQMNPAKLRSPATKIDLFNCDLTNGTTEVSCNRIALYEAGARTPAWDDAFVAYCLSVEDGNAKPLTSP